MEEQANPLRGELFLERPNGASLGVRLDLNAICVAERVLGGRAISDLTLEFASGQVSGTVVRAIIWAGVQGYRSAHPKKGQKPFTLEDAGRLIYDEVGIAKAAAVAAEAIKLAFPTEGDADPGQDGEAGEGDEPGKPTATSSGEGS